jgi:hypothetical protein
MHLPTAVWIMRSSLVDLTCSGCVILARCSNNTTSTVTVGVYRLLRVPHSCTGTVPVPVLDLVRIPYRYRLGSTSTGRKFLQLYSVLTGTYEYEYSRSHGCVVLDLVADTNVQLYLASTSRYRYNNVICRLGSK